MILLNHKLFFYSFINDTISIVVSCFSMGSVTISLFSDQVRSSNSLALFFLAS